MEKQQESRCCCSETPTENVTETQDKKAPQLKSAEGASGPMAMGMNMAKKMMSQMGQDGSPMEMMQKMMAQMHQPGESKPPMEKMMGMCMGMCGEMLSAIKTTNALAVWATPELRTAFSEWLKVTEGEAMTLVANGKTDTVSLAAALKLSEESTRYILNRLAEAGKITLSAKPA